MAMAIREMATQVEVGPVICPFPSDASFGWKIFFIVPLEEPPKRVGALGRSLRTC